MKCFLFASISSCILVVTFAFSPSWDGRTPFQPRILPPCKTATTPCHAASSSSGNDGRLAVINVFVNVAASILSVPRNALQPFGPPMMEPPPRSVREQQRRDVASRLLELTFHNDDNPLINDIFTLPDSDKQVFSEYSQSELSLNPSTYGEVTTRGARQLFYFMGMASSETEDDDDIVFYDLGMGRGKLVVQAFLELDVERSVGIELSRYRHQAAVLAWQLILDGYPVLDDATDRASFLQGDLFRQDLTDATHVYIASLCFTDSMMEDLGRKLIDHPPPRLKCLASLKQIPGLDSRRAEYVEMTWTMPNGCPVYFYDFNN